MREKLGIFASKITKLNFLKAKELVFRRGQGMLPKPHSYGPGRGQQILKIFTSSHDGLLGSE